MQKIAFSLLLFFSCLVRVQANDSLTLAQSYINLSLTVEYFDSLSSERVARILPFLEGELKGISNQQFRQENEVLLLLSEAQLQFLETKHSFVNRKSLTRTQLLHWKAQLDSANSLVNEIWKSSHPSDWKGNEYYQLIGVTKENFELLTKGISSLKDSLNKQVNLDLYPDFKRLYFKAKNQGDYQFDSLQYLVGIYGMSLNFEILENSDFPREKIPSKNNPKGTLRYELAQGIALINQYLQLDYIAKKAKHVDSRPELHNSMAKLRVQFNPEDSLNFNDLFGLYRQDIPKDEFFRTEFSAKNIDDLSKKLNKKFPLRPGETLRLDLSQNAGMGLEPKPAVEKFYFPKVAPFPSSKIAIPDFLPATERLGDVDTHIRKSFEAAGYQGRLHYFYLHEPGFAVTTAIERIQKDGSPVSPEDTRWDLRGNPSGSFSLYQVFRSIFFATESDFRIIACLVSAAEARTGSEQGSFGFFTRLLENSYSTLPKDLRNMKLKDKTLTILVYHFFQSDIGQVPVLDQSKRLTVNQHLEKTPSLRNLTAN
ncbi:hypothetical protein ACFPIK_16295 [Algoriphagus aquatilis]|uniref:Uncharacterized protein n=1 Tax=Algoriphagus aquatilis TaxID=490186 RepID=A0ABW0C255_9BACT